MAFFRPLVPAFVGQDWWDSWDYPSRILDQHFGVELFDEDLLPPTLYRGFWLRPRTQQSIDSSGHSEVTNDSDKFQVDLNVSQFKPEELEIKTVDNYVVLHAKHEEQSDDGGIIFREFSRRYMLPRGCKPESVTSSLTPEGILTVKAPKLAIEDQPKKEQNVPIEKK